MEGKKYQWPQAFAGLVSQEPFLYSPLLHDQVRNKATELATQFNDLYHFFLNRFVRLSQEASITHVQEKELEALLKELLKVRRQLENLEKK